MTFGALSFASPGLLLALFALPILWLILRAIPPAPIRRRFPGVALLLGLRDDESTSDRTPWWLLVLRMLALAALIIGLAGPDLSPKEDTSGTGPILFIVDGSWAGAAQWTKTQSVLTAQLRDAGRDGRAVAVLRLSDPQAPLFQGADAWVSRLPGIQPEAWQPSANDIENAIVALTNVGSFETRWFSDGLDYPGRTDLLTALEAKGAVQVYQTGSSALGLLPPVLEGSVITLTGMRAVPGAARDVVVLAQGRDPAGQARVLARVPLVFEAGETTAKAQLSLPNEQRARLSRFELDGVRSAGAVTLTGDALRKREVALMSGREDREGLELLSPMHYLQNALQETADLLDGPLATILPANPDAVILADVAQLTAQDKDALQDWVEKGGTLLRFAGPRMAASDISRAEEDALMPVRLRSGGRTVGGALSWGQPKTLAPFPKDSPFVGLTIPDDVQVISQVVAQPDPTLADRVLATLSDGTPLVTRKALGQGQVVLFHVTANAEWSTLPLSGLFVEMLDRLAISSGGSANIGEDLGEAIWTPVEIMDGFGTLRDAGTRPGVPGQQLSTQAVGPDIPPGLYQSDDRLFVRNVLDSDASLAAAIWPAHIPVAGLALGADVPLAGMLLALALILLSVDIFASLALSGRLRSAPGAVAATAFALMIWPDPGATQTADDLAGAATDEVVFAHVLTGDAALDDLANAGLRGLSDTLFFRTTVEPALPIGVDLERDELAFFPLLYWPVTPDQPIPSAEAYAKLNAYLRSGGLILFDTRDADIAGFGAASPNGRHLQKLAAGLDIPPLEPVPNDHVLTRTFYLLRDFPGRHTGREVWVEAAPPDAEQIEGMPFRNLNDGVTPVIIGGNDWAAAWAVDSDGRPLLPVGRGYAGERQREMAHRFGVNLVMHVLTGNYKSDQVHVPALLDRLGQ